MTIHLTRESVCMGDDVNAPNAGTLELPATTPLPDVLARIHDEHYLAAVAGNVTWSLWAGPQLLAIIRVPALGPTHYLYTAGSKSLLAADLPALFFDYHCNADPAAVLRDPTLRR